MRKLIQIFLLLLMVSEAFTQSFTDSNLPVVIIDTDGGVSIPDDPRVNASMKIIYRGEGQRNFVSDQANPAFLNYNGRINIEIRGSSSQVLPKKQFGFTTLLPDDKTDNDVSLLGLPAESDWIINGLAFDASLIRDYLCYNLARQTGQYATRTVYCEVIINGTYNGLYILQEKIKQDANRVNVIKISANDISFPEVTGGYITAADKPDDDPVAWRMSSYIASNDISFIHVLPKPENIKQQQNDYIKGVFLNLGNASFNKNNSLTDGIPSIIDIPSWIDYMLLNELAANTDAYQYSTFFHKDRNGKLRAGPVWDMNLTFGNDLFMYGFDRSKTDTWQFSNKDNEGAAFWKDLFNDPVFLCLLARRWKELTAPGNPFNKVAIESFIDQTISHISEASAREQMRWGTVGNLDSNVSKIKKFISDRIAWINSQIPARPDCFFPEPPSLVISKIMYQPLAGSNDPEFIEITNNGSSAIDLTGIYFGGTGFVYQFPNYSLILPGSSLVLTNNSTGFSAKYGIKSFGQYIRNLPDKGFDLLLLDGYGTVIDRVNYSSSLPWPAAGGTGEYLVLSDLTSDNNDPMKWTAEDNIKVSVEVTEAPTVRFYPNPVRDMLHIESDDPVHHVELLDLFGKTLHKTKPGVEVTEVDTDFIPPGLYLLKVYSGNKVSVQKILKY